eukprot:scaffold114890_cov21-Tisochrysis_lutea.AAC.2
MAGDGMGWHQQIYQTVKVCSACSGNNAATIAGHFGAPQIKNQHLLLTLCGALQNTKQDAHQSARCVRVCTCVNWQLMDLMSQAARGSTVLVCVCVCVRVRAFA